jgi:uncharacterized protein HemY
MIERVMSNPMVQQLLLDSLYWFFLVFGIFGIAVGVGLALNHVRMHRFSRFMNRWVSMRRSTKWLAIPRDSGAAVQRFRYLLGAVFVVFPAFSLFVLIAKIDADKLATALHLNVPPAFAAWILESARWFLIAGSLLAIAVGVMLIFFPKALHAIETRTNRWYSTRNMSRGGEIERMGFDAWVECHPRAMGLIIASGALVVAVHFGMLLFQRG